MDNEQASTSTGHKKKKESRKRDFGQTGICFRKLCTCRLLYFKPYVNHFIFGLDSNNLNDIDVTSSKNTSVITHIYHGPVEYHQPQKEVPSHKSKYKNEKVDFSHGRLNIKIL